MIKHMYGLLAVIAFVVVCAFGCATEPVTPEPFVFQIKVIKIDGSTISVTVPGNTLDVSRSPDEPGALTVTSSRNQGVYTLEANNVQGVFVTAIHQDGSREHHYFKTTPYETPHGVRVGLVPETAGTTPPMKGN